MTADKRPDAQRVVVTGMGIVSCLGNSLDAVDSYRIVLAAELVAAVRALPMRGTPPGDRPVAAALAYAQHGYYSVWLFRTDRWKCGSMNPR